MSTERRRPPAGGTASPPREPGGEDAAGQPPGRRRSASLVVAGGPGSFRLIEAFELQAGGSETLVQKAGIPRRDRLPARS